MMLVELFLESFIQVPFAVLTSDIGSLKTSHRSINKIFISSARFKMIFYGYYEI